MEEKGSNISELKKQKGVLNMAANEAIAWEDKNIQSDCEETYPIYPKIIAHIKANPATTLTKGSSDVEAHLKEVLGKFYKPET